MTGDTLQDETMQIDVDKNNNVYGSFSRKQDVYRQLAKERTRWVVLGLLSMLSGLNQSICYTYAPISTMAEKKWNEQLTPATLITLYFVTYIPSSFFGSWFMDYYGLRNGVILGALLQGAGSWLRYFSSITEIYGEVRLVFVGQLLSSIAMPFMVNSPPILSANWFPPNERTMSTSIAVNANSLGIAFIYFLVPFVVVDSTDIHKVELIVAIACTATLIPTICFFQTASPCLRKLNQCSVNLTKDYSWTQWLNAFKHEGFWQTVLCFSVVECVINTTSARLNHFLLPEGFTKMQIGFSGGFFIICGLVGSQIISKVVGRNRKYRFFLLVCLSISSCCMILFKLSNSERKWAATLVFLLLTGFFLGPLQPISLELGIECAYPTSEATIAAIQQLSGNLLSALFVPFVSVLHHYFKDSNGHIDGKYFYACAEPIMSFMMCISAISLLFFKGKQKRADWENRPSP